MNWITKAINIGQKIKKILKRRPTKEEIENSDWTSCCTGPILKKDLEANFWICNACGKHHRISCIQRFDSLFGKNNQFHYKFVFVSQYMEIGEVGENVINRIGSKSTRIA